MDRYAVIGNPIEHSKSPQIHAAFAAQTGQALVYERLLGELGGFEDQVRGFFAQGGGGLNVTVPFKERAADLCDELSAAAQTAGAANTLSFRSGRIVGENTDGIGLVRDLVRNHGFSLGGARVLLLGAGGAARGVLRPLLGERPAGLVVANRTAAKAEALAAVSAALGPVSGCGLDALGSRQFDLVINATAAGLSARVPAIPDGCLTPGGWVYDMLYASTPTAFVRWGRAQGAAVALDGLGMLVEQAAAAFAIWRGVHPETAPVIATLRPE